MDVARHVFSTYFQDTTNPLVRHHLDSFSDLLTTKIPNFIRGSNPQRLILDESRTVDVYIGGNLYIRNDLKFEFLYLLIF